jgi:RNA 2',3'-cyclic 3'-phosphodiesterase
MARDRASRPDAKPLRLFVAIEVPLEVRELVASAIAPWRETHPRARWVPRQNQHVTMKFLGATWPRLVAWVKEAVGEAAGGAKPFDSRIDGLGAFPSARRARVLWAGLEDPDGRLAALAALLDEALAKEFEREKRAFTAHLTLARFEPQAELDGLDGSSLASESFSVNRLLLFRSHLQRPVPVYEPLGEYPLGG